MQKSSAEKRCDFEQVSFVIGGSKHGTENNTVVTKTQVFIPKYIFTILITIVGSNYFLLQELPTESLVQKIYKKTHQ